MKNKYFLGIRKEDGMKVYMEKENWDCDWYWGFGYVRTYKRGDVFDYQHFDNLFLSGNIFDSYKDYFIESTLNDDEIWMLLGYMKEYYVLKEYAELLQYGNWISIGAKAVLEDKYKEKNELEVERINKILLPEVFYKIDKLFDKGGN